MRTCKRTCENGDSKANFSETEIAASGGKAVLPTRQGVETEESGYCSAFPMDTSHEADFGVSLRPDLKKSFRGNFNILLFRFS